MGRRVKTVDRAMVRRVVKVRLDCDLLAGLVPGAAATTSAIVIVEDGAPCLGVALFNCKTADGAGDHAVNRSLVVVSVRPPGPCPIPGHRCRSCAQVTRPGTTPRGTPNGESVGSNREEPMVLAAAIERANCR